MKINFINFHVIKADNGYVVDVYVNEETCPRTYVFQNPDGVGNFVTL